MITRSEARAGRCGYVVHSAFRSGRRRRPPIALFFFFNDTATTEIYTLSLHDALPICLFVQIDAAARLHAAQGLSIHRGLQSSRDRKSTRLNSSHQIISYAVFCLKKKKPRRTTYADAAICHLFPDCGPSSGESEISSHR